MTIVDDKTTKDMESFLCTLSISNELVAKGFEVIIPSWVLKLFLPANVDITITDNDGMQDRQHTHIM